MQFIPMKLKPHEATHRFEANRFEANRFEAKCAGILARRWSVHWQVATVSIIRLSSSPSSLYA